MNPAVSIVIPTYNRRDLLKEVLLALSTQDLSREKFEVCLVDDGSTDGTGEMVRSLSPGYDLRYFFQKNEGSGSARNLGIREARGEIVLFIDDDTIPHEKIISAHVAAHRSSKRLVARGIIVNVQDLNLVRTSRESLVKYPWRYFSLNFFCTSNVSVRKEFLDQAGLFDESYIRWQDAELGFRLRKLGLRGKFIPEAIVFHFKPVPTPEEIARLARSDGKDAGRMAIKHRGPRVRMATGMNLPNLLFGWLLCNSSAARFYGKFLSSPVTKKMVPLGPLFRRLYYHHHFLLGLQEVRLQGQARQEETAGMHSGQSLDQERGGESRDE